MDTIGDFLTIIRNATLASLPSCEARVSRLRISVLYILKKAGFIESFDVGENGFLRIHLKYVDGVSSIGKIERCSRPGCRSYYNAKKIPRVLNGLGMGIVSTSRGIMSDGEARRINVGGELLCKVW